MPAVVSARGLVKEYGRFRNRRRALNGVDVEVQEGETFGLLGPNGAGKTTFVKCLLGLLRPTEGSVSLWGATPTDASSREKVGFAPESPNFPGFLSGIEVMTYQGLLAGMSEKDAKSAGQKLMLDADLTHPPKRVKAYSKGMVRRLAVAQALMNDPRLLVLDEPTADLDPLGRRDIRVKLEELKKQGVTIILNSHLLSEVERVCDRIVIIHEGSVIATGTLKELVPEGGDLETVFVDLVQKARAT